MFLIKVAEEIKTVCSVTFSFENPVVYEIMWNIYIYCRAGQATDDSMAHAHYMLDA